MPRRRRDPRGLWYRVTGRGPTGRPLIILARCRAPGGKVVLLRDLLPDPRDSDVYLAAIVPVRKPGIVGE